MKALVYNPTIPRYLALQVLRPLGGRFCYRGPLATIRLADIPEPDLPSQEWVKIKTMLCGVCGSDINLIMLRDSLTASPFTSFPCVPGHELCGEIVEAGRDAKGWKPGDRVTIAPMLSCETRGIRPACRACEAGRPANCENFAEGSLSPGMFTGICRDAGGGFGEYLVAHRGQLHRVPDGMSPAGASLVEPLAVALQAVLDNPPARGERILVIGGGAIGSMTVRCIRALGARCDVTVAEPSPFAAEYAAKSGADRVIRGDIIAQAEAITGGKAYRPLLGERILMGGFDRVFDTVGHRDTLAVSMRVLATGGVLSVIGIGKDVKLDLTPLWLKVQTVKGCYAYGYNRTKAGKRQAFAMALEMIAKKKVMVDDMITHTFTLPEYRKMIEVNLNKNAHRAMKTAVRYD